MLFSSKELPMAKGPTINEFMAQFPDDDSCLDYLMRLRHGDKIECPKCGKTGKFHRIRRHPAYECAWCGFEIFPMVGTIFHRSHTPLQKWFYAMYLFTTSRHGVPAKELQRQLGVTYKTAWRMGHEIRKYMGKVDGDSGLSGHVEVDETYVGGKIEVGPGDSRLSNKTAVMGMVERGGNVMTKVVPNVKTRTLIPIIQRNIAKGSMISSDENLVYRNLRKEGYKHGACNHNLRLWVNGIHHTNTLEGFWSHLKNSIKGTHVHVSKKHLAKYLAEFENRDN